MAQAVIKYFSPGTDAVWYSAPMPLHEAYYLFRQMQEMNDTGQGTCGVFIEGTPQFEEGDRQWKEFLSGGMLIIR